MKDAFEVIIIGGSYAGLSAALALGRSLRQVLVIDSGLPCNRQTPHSHNFLTHDGHTPAAIAAAAREEVSHYPTVRLMQGKAVSGKKVEQRFEIETESGDRYQAKKLLFATGMKDHMPALPGFAECWGISVLHCPYCHGYEVRQLPTGILANGEIGFELARLIRHWTPQLQVFTNGTAEFTAEQREKFQHHQIEIIETPIQQLIHEKGHVQSVQLQTGEQIPISALYARPVMTQHCTIPESLGCELTPQALLKVDMMHRTNVPGVYAAGDNMNMMRSVALAVSAGGFAGAAINRELIEEWF